MKNSLKISILSIFVFLLTNTSKAQTNDFTWDDIGGCVSQVEVFDATNTLLFSTTTCCGAASCFTGTPSTVRVTFTGGGTSTITLVWGTPVNVAGCQPNPPGNGITVTFGPGGAICGPGSRILSVQTM